MASSSPPASTPAPGHPEPPQLPSAGGGGSRAFSLPQAIGLLFLGAQAIFVLQTWLNPNDPRLLTPVEGVTRYELTATMDAVPLTPSLVRDRYGIAPSGMLCLRATAVEEVVAHREKPIPLSRAMFVRLRTKRPNGTEEFWLWPQE